MHIEPTITKTNRNQYGFTLVELVLVMVLSAILAVVVSVFIARPISAYTSTAQRATLVDAADMALRRMARDIQSAVPNSVRVKNSGNQHAVEMLNIVEGMRYRGSIVGPYVDFTAPITNFHVIGQFQYANTNPTCTAGNCRLVIYNTGANTGGAIPSDNPSPGANVYSLSAAPACSPGPGCLPPPGSVVITPLGTTVTLTNPGPEGNVLMSSSTQFGLPSPRQRLDIVDTPITYLCDTSTNTITRYSGYAITQVQPLVPVGATSALLTNNVTACSFTYNPGTAQRNGVITMSITLTKSEETITLMRQVGVNNSP